MDVRVITNLPSSAPSFHVFDQEYSYNKKSLPALNEASIQRHKGSLLANDKLSLLNRETRSDNSPSDEQHINRYHSDMVQSLARKNNKVFASNFLHGSAHFVENVYRFKNVHGTDHSANKSSPTSDMQNLTLKSKFSIYGEENTAAKQFNCNLSQMQGQRSKANNIEPSVEKAEVHAKNKSSGKKSKKHRTKSGKKKRGKSALKKKKSHKSADDVNKSSNVPKKHNLDSCFTLYTTQNRNNKAHLHTSNKRNSNKLKSAEFVDINSLMQKTPELVDSKTLLPPQRTNLNGFSLPPTSLPNAIVSKIVPAAITKRRNSTPANSTSVPLIAPVTLHHAKSLQTNKDEIILPPAPICNKSPINSTKVEAGGEVQQRKHLIAKGHAREGTFLGKLSYESKLNKKRDHSLGERLSLIHSYGTAYQTVTKQLEMQQKKEEALKQQLCKVAERISREKKKSEQRKKIYALNNLMTKLEHQKFKEFMDSLQNENKASTTEL